MTDLERWLQPPCPAAEGTLVMPKLATVGVVPTVVLYERVKYEDMAQPHIASVYTRLAGKEGDPSPTPRKKQPGGA